VVYEVWPNSPAAECRIHLFGHAVSELTAPLASQLSFFTWPSTEDPPPNA